MSKVIVIANQKGGVAKTTTAVNLSAFLATTGKKTLLIDLDPQGNASSGAGVSQQSEKGVYQALIGTEPIENVITPTPLTNLFVAPADISLVGAEIELVTTEGRERSLERSLSQIVSKNEYEFVIIDTPPSLGVLTLNALTVADSVLIPMQCEYYALEGLAQLYKTISLVRQKLNHKLQIEGLVFSMVDLRANLTQQVIDEVRKFLKDKVYQTIIPRNIRLAEAPSHGKPIFVYDRASKGAEAYERLGREFLSRQNAGSEISRPDANEPGADLAPQPAEPTTPQEVTS